MTSSERARQALGLFDDWVDLPPARQQQHLRDLAARDPALHAEVLALLDADAADGLLERDADAVLSALAPAGDAAEAFVARRIGPWQVTGIIGNITKAASEQSSGISQVSEALTQLDDMTQQNTALVEQSAAAAESLKEQSVLLSKVLKTFHLHQPA